MHIRKLTKLDRGSTASRIPSDGRLNLLSKSNGLLSLPKAFSMSSLFPVAGHRWNSRTVHRGVFLSTEAIFQYHLIVDRSRQHHDAVSASVCDSEPRTTQPQTARPPVLRMAPRADLPQDPFSNIICTAPIFTRENDAQSTLPTSHSARRSPRRATHLCKSFRASIPARSSHPTEYISIFR